MHLFARKVLPTNLDPVPRNFRAVPGCLAVNERELAELNAGNGETFKMLAQISRAEDMADANRTWVLHKRKATRVGPSVRMSMLNALGKR